MIVAFSNFSGYSINGKQSKHFQIENPVFKFLQRSVVGALINGNKFSFTRCRCPVEETTSGISSNQVGVSRNKSSMCFTTINLTLHKLVLKH